MIELTPGQKAAAGPLAGVPEPVAEVPTQGGLPVIPGAAPQSGASTVAASPTPIGGPALVMPASPQTLSVQDMVKGWDAAAANNPEPTAPGSWARNILAGAQAALSDLGNIGQAPKGAGKLGGAFYGLGKVMESQQARAAAARAEAAKQRQQQIENAREDKRLAAQLDLTAVQINEANIKGHETLMNMALQNRQLRASDQAQRDDQKKNDAVWCDMYDRAGAEVITEGSYDVAMKEADEKVGKARIGLLHAFIVDWVPRVNADGTPVMRQIVGAPVGEMEPAYDAVYKVYLMPNKIQMTKELATYLDQWLPRPEKDREGKPLKYSTDAYVSSDQVISWIKKADLAKTTSENMDKEEAQIRLYKVEAEEKEYTLEQQKIRDARKKVIESDLTVDLSLAEGDPEKMQVNLINMLSDPAIANDPAKKAAIQKKIGEIEEYYGAGVESAARAKRIDQLNAEIDKEQKFMASVMDKSDPQYAAAQARIDGYNKMIRALLPIGQAAPPPPPPPAVTPAAKAGQEAKATLAAQREKQTAAKQDQNDLIAAKIAVTPKLPAEVVVAGAGMPVQGAMNPNQNYDATFAKIVVRAGYVDEDGKVKDEKGLLQAYQEYKAPILTTKPLKDASGKPINVIGAAPDKDTGLMYWVAEDVGPNGEKIQRKVGRAPQQP
jgi:hypothetical protein